MWGCLADLIFPPQCIECGLLLQDTRDIPFCASCFSEITFVHPPLCTSCGLPFQSQVEDNHLCSDCIASPPFFSAARAVGLYDKILLEAIHRFKYNRHILSGRALGKLMASYCYPLFEWSQNDLIIPVPLHPKRLRHRGFNQAVILGREIAVRFRLKLKVDTLRRCVHTLPQFDLGRNERGPNVKGAFEVRKPQEIEGRRIILIDDVYTTGSTVKECARTLLQAGAEEVAVLTLARAL